MRIDKSHLKLGVALAATFGFGFMAGRVYEAHKFQKVMTDGMSKWESFKDEVFRDIQEQGEVPIIEAPAEPEEDENLEESKEEDPMAKKLTEKDKEAIIAAEREKAWKKGYDEARLRVGAFPRLRAKEDPPGKWEELVENILASEGREPFFIEDTTPWGCSMEKDLMCVVFDKEARQFYWNDFSVVQGDFTQEDIDYFIFAFFCLSLYRKDGDDQVWPYFISAEQAFFSPDFFMVYDDHVYTETNRSLYLPAIDKEVFIRAVEEVKDPAVIREYLAEIINYNGGADPYFEERDSIAMMTEED